MTSIPPRPEPPTAADPDSPHHFGAMPPESIESARWTFKEGRRRIMAEAAAGPPASAELLERLAAIEHEQWMAWSKAVVQTEPNLSRDRIERWAELWRPYSTLSEADKEHDRVWARKVIAALPASAERVTRESLAAALNKTVGTNGWIRFDPPDPVNEWLANADAILAALPEAAAGPPASAERVTDVDGIVAELMGVEAHLDEARERLIKANATLAAQPPPASEEQIRADERDRMRAWMEDNFPNLPDLYEQWAREESRWRSLPRHIGTPTAQPPPASVEAEGVTRLLKDLVDEVGAEPVNDNRARRMGAWLRARNYFDTLPEAAVQEPHEARESGGTRAMYGRLAKAHSTEPAVPDHGGGVRGDRYPLKDAATRPPREP